MGNICMNKEEDSSSVTARQPKTRKEGGRRRNKAVVVLQPPNGIISEVNLQSDSMNIQLFSGFCSMDKSDVTINISDEFISKISSEQEIKLFNQAGVELARETAEYIQRHQKLHYKMPFYTHAGELAVTNVIHCTLSENKRVITENQIIATIMECLLIADEELEATSISIPMISLRNYSLNRISKIVLRSLKTFLDKSKKARSTTKQHHLQLIKLIGDDPQQQQAYLNAMFDIFQVPQNSASSRTKMVSHACSPDAMSSVGDRIESYIPSFKSDRSLSNYNVRPMPSKLS